MLLKANFNKCDSHGWSPLMYACREGHIEIVRILLDKGADYNRCDKYGYAPGNVASERGHSDIVSVINEYSRNETGI